MSGTPEKILEHLLESVRLDTYGSDATGVYSAITHRVLSSGYVEHWSNTRFYSYSMFIELLS